MKRAIKGEKGSKTKSTVKAETQEQAPANSPEKVLVLRSNAADLSSSHGFKWPESGPVSCPDWNPVAECGHGLHGFLWGEGDGSLASFAPEAKWLVVEVLASDIVNLNGKVKFPKGDVVFCGPRDDAALYLSQRAPGRSIIAGTSTSGYGGTSTSGYGGTSTSGYGGTSTSGNYGKSTSGYGGTSTSGDRGTSTSGYGGTSTSGDRGTSTSGNYGKSTSGEGGILHLSWWDGKRQRVATFYVGEEGIEPNIAYKLDDAHKAVKA